MKCINCKKKFEPKRNGQSVCGFECSIEYQQKQRDKNWKKRKKVLKEKIKTLSDYKKECQTIFNKIIRTIDNGYDCIACGSSNPSDAGHYKSVGSYPELRYDPFNCWIECRKCNGYFGGKPIEMREGLINLYGKENFETMIEDISYFPKWDMSNIKELKIMLREYLKSIDSDKIYNKEERIKLRKNLYDELINL